MGHLDESANQLTTLRIHPNFFGLLALYSKVGASTPASRTSFTYETHHERHEIHESSKEIFASGSNLISSLAKVIVVPWFLRIDARAEAPMFRVFRVFRGPHFLSCT